MFLRLKLSEAAVNTETLPAPAASARSKPCSLGTSAEYTTPDRRAMSWKTFSESAICGTVLGLTKAPASISRRPVAESASI